MVVLRVEELKDKDKVLSFLVKSLESELSWTTLVCDWCRVREDITYSLAFSSGFEPWGYYYRLPTKKGYRWLSPLNHGELEDILIHLISSYCLTKYGNGVSGRDTLYEYIPKSKKVWEGQ